MNMFALSWFVVLSAAGDEKGFPWEATTAFATVATVIAAFVVAWYTSRDLRRTSSGGLIVTLSGEWGSDRMRQQRQLLSDDLLNEWKKQATDSPRKLDDMNTEVLDFFENLSYLTERGVLDERMVSNIFAWDISCYYLAVTRFAAERRGEHCNLIQEMRRDSRNRAVYCMIEKLHKGLQTIDMRESGTGQVSQVVEPSQSEVEKYLRQEQEGYPDTDTKQLRQEIERFRDQLEDSEKRLLQVQSNVEEYLRKEREDSKGTATKQMQEIEGTQRRLEGLEQRLSQAESRANV